MSQVREEGIVGIALLFARVERVVIGRIQRRTATETLDQIRVGQQQPAERDRVGGAGGHRLLRRLEIIAIVADQVARIQRAQPVVIERQPLFPRRAAGSLQHVEKRQAAAD